MKQVYKQAEPALLKDFRTRFPQESWEQMRNSAPATYAACREQVLADQHGICAYCEIDIGDNDPLKCRVEHFQPKSTRSLGYNCDLDWNNLLGVCAGGSYKFGDAPYTQEPLAKNLSCDAYKDQVIQTHKLSEKNSGWQCNGWILNPFQLRTAPSLFMIDRSDGKLQPDAKQCAAMPVWPGNQHKDVEVLVQHTIDMLNLNCDRLCSARLVVARNIERNKKARRKKGLTLEQSLSDLATFYLSHQPHRWPGFFTTIRICLGQAAENHIASMAKQGVI